MSKTILYVLLLAGLLVAPFIGYPIFLMSCLCFALFASAFNLLIGFTGLLSFGHAMFLALQRTCRAMRQKSGASHLKCV